MPGARPTSRLTCLVREDFLELGNAKRELRIEALDPSGQAGYYSKKLLDKSWTFVAYPDRARRELKPIVPSEARGKPHTVHLKADKIPFISDPKLQTKLTATLDWTLHEYVHPLKLTISGAAHATTQWDCTLMTRCPLPENPDGTVTYIGFLKVPNNMFGQLIWDKNATEVCARLFNQTDEWKVLVTVPKNNAWVHVSSFVSIKTQHEERQEIDFAFTS